MHREGHIGAALLAYAPLGLVTLVAGFEAVAVLGAVGAAGLAMLPDYDQRIPFLEHRGITHTVWFAGAVALFLAVSGVAIGYARGSILDAVGLAVFGALLGAVTIGSHVLADSLTPAGIQPFFPQSKRWYSFDVATASNPLANYALFALGIAAVGVAWWAGSAVSEMFGTILFLG